MKKPGAATRHRARVYSLKPQFSFANSRSTILAGSGT